MAAALPALIVQQKLAALAIVAGLSRARGRSQQGVRWPYRRRADFFFAYSLGRVAAIELTIEVDRPLPSQGVGFDNTRFAAALRLPR